jgi:hypothetical protein
MTADNPGRVQTTLEYRPSAGTAMDDPARLAHTYGSEGRVMGQFVALAQREPWLFLPLRG